MKSLLIWIDKWMPRRLTTRMTLSVIAIVVTAGLITTVVINAILVRNLRSEVTASGRALTLAVGESLANSLIEGNLVAVQEILDGVVRDNKDVVYAFAFGPYTPVVHTFAQGFPTDLLTLVPVTQEDPGEGRLLQTEQGLVRDFGYRPLDGVPAEVHLGISEERVAIIRRQVTRAVLGMTLLGCIAAIGVAYGLGRVVTFPLVQLTQHARRLGTGHLNERISLPPEGEVGELAAAFNHMAENIQQAIQQLRVSEAGYRALLTAASTVGEGIALIREEGEQEGTFLYVNEAFTRLTGHEPRDLIGMNVATILHPDSLHAARNAWDAIRQNQARGPYEFVLLDRNGRTHIVETTGTLLEYQGQRVLAWFTHDITERKRREEELRRRNRELAALNAVASAVGGLLSPDEVLRRALRQALTALDLSTGWIFILDKDDSVRLAAAYGLDTVDFAFPACMCGDVLRTGTPRMLCNLDKRCIAYGAGEEVRCHITVPIVAGKRRLGVLSVGASTCERFDRSEVNILLSIGHQIGMALENARLWEEVQEKERIRSTLLAQLIRAQEEERRRVARELHDGIGQSLNALVLGLNTAMAALERAPDMVPTLIKRLRLSVSDVVRELQDVIYDLRPSILDDLGLVRALHWYAEERLKPLGIHVVFDVPSSLPRLASEVETTLFRIGQEALTNVVKHAQATQVVVRIGHNRELIWLEVTDNGRGFKEDVGSKMNRKHRPGWGLLNIEERASLLGGQTIIESQLNKGTRVYVEVPIGVS